MEAPRKLDMAPYVALTHAGYSSEEISARARGDGVPPSLIVRVLMTAYGMRQRRAEQVVYGVYSHLRQECATADAAYDRLKGQRFHPADVMDILQYVFRLSHAGAKALMLRRETGMSLSEYQATLIEPVEQAFRGDEA